MDTVCYISMIARQILEEHIKCTEYAQTLFSSRVFLQSINKISIKLAKIFTSLFVYLFIYLSYILEVCFLMKWILKNISGHFSSVIVTANLHLWFYCPSLSSMIKWTEILRSQITQTTLSIVPCVCITKMFLLSFYNGSRAG